MENSIQKPWFWMEPDLVPLRPGWLDILQEEYNRCGKDVMGSVVPGMGHVNGTSIYPPNLFTMCPMLFSTPNGQWAFDMVMHNEIAHSLHDASHLMQHAWTMSGSTLSPHGGGELPSFMSPQSLGMLLPTAVTFHRVKDTSLIQRLRECR